VEPNRSYDLEAASTGRYRLIVAFVCSCVTGVRYRRWSRDRLPGCLQLLSGAAPAGSVEVCFERNEERW